MAAIDSIRAASATTNSGTFTADAVNGCARAEAEAETPVPSVPRGPSGARPADAGAAVLRGIARAALVVAVAIALWWLLTDATGLVSGMRFPPPGETLAAARQIAIDGYGNARLHEHVVRSVLLVTAGFAVAATLGVALGLAMGASRVVEALVNPAFLFLRPIPPLAWIPLAIVWLGLGDAAKILVIFVAAFVPAVINTYAGVRQIERPVLEASAMLAASPWRHLSQVLVPGALPSIFTGLRLSLQASWTTLVAAELVGAVAGLGQILNQGAQDIYPAMILVGMIAVALCGWLMTVGLAWVEARLMPWRSR